MTEDEAKTKWCPHYQVTSPDDDDNRSTRFDVATKTYSATLRNACCLGSACMAWRWITVADESGYCGLAGKP